jgi:hypothetical protein
MPHTTTDHEAVPENSPTGQCAIPCVCAALRRTIAAHRKDLLRVEARILALEAALAQRGQLAVEEGDQ